VFGNNNTDTCARVCHSPTGYGLGQTFGTSAGTQDFDSASNTPTSSSSSAPTRPTGTRSSRAASRSGCAQGAKLIVIDPRRIDLVRSPHVEAAHHLPLRPGTNVAVVTALAHVIVTEGLMDEAFIRERCDWDEFADYAEFVADPRHSPEATELLTGVPAADLRAAGAALRHRRQRRDLLRPRRDRAQPGLDHRHGHREPRHADRQHRPQGRGREPAARPEQRAGLLRHGQLPARAAGLPPRQERRRPRHLRGVWGVAIDPEPGLRIPNMLDAAVEGTFKGLYCQGEDILQSDPDTRHVAAGLAAMDCVIVQDLFLNETANYAHVFLPGSTFLEKDGTFTNAERRINRVRRVMAAPQRLCRLGDHADAGQRHGRGLAYTHPAQIMDEIAATTPSFAGVSYELLEEKGSVQWPCNEAAPEGTPLMHVDGFVRGKGRFIVTEYVATDERTGPRFPLLLTTGRILSQYNVGAQTRRTANVVWHEEDVLEIHPHDAEVRGVRTATRQARLALGRDDAARASPTGCRRASSTRPSTTPTRRPTSSPPTFRLGHELPGIQGDGGAGLAVERPDRLAGGLRRAGRTLAPHPAGGGMTDHRPSGAPALSPREARPRRTARCRGGARGARLQRDDAGRDDGLAQDLEDFALGFSLTEGIIDAPAEIESLEIVEHARGLEARMWIAPPRAEALAARRRAMAGPVGCGLCGIDSLERGAPSRAAVADTPSPSGLSDVAAAWRRSATASPCTTAPAPCMRPASGCRAGDRRWRARTSAATTRSTSSRRALLGDGIGRTGAVVLTSRVSLDMVQKTAAGAPVLVAASAPTAHAVRLAEGPASPSSPTRAGRLRCLHPPRPDPPRGRLPCRLTSSSTWRTRSPPSSKPSRARPGRPRGAASARLLGPRMRTQIAAIAGGTRIGPLAPRRSEAAEFTHICPDLGRRKDVFTTPSVGLVAVRCVATRPCSE
jgi:hypothetical protein